VAGIVPIFYVSVQAVSDLKTQHPDGVPLPQILLLLERLTIRLPIDDPQASPRRLKTKLGPAKEERLEWLIWTFRTRWVEWIGEPETRSTGLVEESEQVSRGLATLTPESQPLRPMLRQRFGSATRITLGAWSCPLPRNWMTRCPRQEFQSEWVVFFLSLKHKRNTREIKEQLGRERQEQKIKETWSSYGQWLRERPEQIRELEKLLEDLKIQAGP